MKLNQLSPAAGSKKARKRVGRGAASGLGKTCGKGNKGQKSRSGGNVARGFEGGQMPLQMRLPKFGFTSRTSRITAEVKLSELKKLEGNEITVETLKNAGLIQRNKSRARIIASGNVDKAFTISGVHVTVGARKVIEEHGGKVI